jgi:RNA 2',3'-cyclic 3'-phosphodiesterase
VSVRLFVALDVPDDARGALARFRDAAADPAIWRPVRDEALHLTLAFLGHRPEEDVEAAAAVVAAVPDAAPPLCLAGALLLPPRRARVLCAEVEDVHGVLAALQATVSERLEAAGLYTPERRPFRPHATVARLRTGARPPRSVDAAPEPLAFPGAAVTLYQSVLRREGAHYEPLARSALA